MNKTVVQLRGQARSAVPPGTRLNDLYEVGEQIAQGGMGEIYRGHQIATGDPVALKMIKPEFTGDEAVMALFHREASALNRLQHESIVRYYIFGTDRIINRTYLAMEFVEGSALSDLMARRALSVAEATELRRRIATGLQVAHDNGIIHRDISPDNIILPEEDVRKAKIIDFGIARSSKPGQATVIGDGFAGKYNYVSPEQAGMFGGDVTARSDIYSLGLLLVASLLGKPIDMGGTMADVIEKRRTVPDLSAVDKQIRPLLEQMLAPDPKDRPSSMTVVAEWVPKDKTVRTKAVSSTSSGEGSSKPPIAAIAGGLAVLVVGGVGAFMMISPSAPPARIDPLPVPAIVSPPPVQPSTPPVAGFQPLPQGMGISLADQAERIVNYVRYYDGDPCLYIRPIDVTARSASVFALARSPDAVRAFQQDFSAVNGFDPVISTAQVLASQCAVVGFLQQIDGKLDSQLIAVMAKPRLRAGERARLTISGVAGRSVAVLVIDEDGSWRNLSSDLNQSGSTTVLDARLDDGGQARPALKVLITVISPQPLAGLPKSAPAESLSRVARDIRGQGTEVVVIPQLVSFDPG